jgi:hypothetical protein
MELDPNTVVIAAITCGVGYLMIVAGLNKSALELRRRQRICPSCGKHLRSRVCRACRA